VVRDAVSRLARTIDEALSLKPAQIEIKTYRAKRDRLEISSAIRMRGRFATRLLQQAQDDGAQRTDTVRTAFNSPFRPFVLASTSLGQEGLDFHPYCQGWCTGTFHRIQWISNNGKAESTGTRTMPSD